MENSVDIHKRFPFVAATQKVRSKRRISRFELLFAVGEKPVSSRNFVDSHG